MKLRDRVVAASALAALAALAVVIVLVFAFGRHDPSPPSLIRHPDPAIPGELIFVENDGCIVRAAASGLSREQAYCLPDGLGGPIGWLDGHTAGIVAYDQRGPVLHEVDFQAKTERDTGRAVPPGKGPIEAGLVSVNGESVSVDEHGAVFVLTDGTRTKVADFDVATYGGPQFLAWSPDGEWMVLQYFPRRGATGAELWILRRDGETAGTIATNVRGQGVSWRVEGLGISPPWLFD